MSTTQPIDPAKETISSNLNRQVSVYAFAAAAAGVAVLALAQPAQGEVVITKKTIPITLNQPAVALDLNHDGVNDFTFSLRSTFSSISTMLVRSFGVRNAAAGKGVVGGGTHIAYASALTRGAKIGPSAIFESGARIEESATRGIPYERDFYGKWGRNPQDRYVGVRFQINGQMHYGWIRLTVTTTPKVHGPFMSATITAYAYETVANKTITAGIKPSVAAKVRDNVDSRSGPSLGMLALGFDGLPEWKGEETPR